MDSIQSDSCKGWTDSDIHFLKQFAKSLDMKEMAASLGRSHTSVRQKCSSLGIKSRRTWTPESTALLIALRQAGLYSCEIAHRLNRSVGSVDVKIHRLKKQGVLR